MNKIYIYLSYHSYRIVISLFMIGVFIVAIIRLVFNQSIPILLGYIFFLLCGMYIGIWLYKKAMKFLAEERTKGNKYLQKLIDNYRKSPS
jgi:ABC-type multidrug transport system permease subunit